MSAVVSLIQSASEPDLPIRRVEEDDGSSSYSHSEEGDVADAPDSEPGQEKDSGVDCGGSDAAIFEQPDEATALKIRQTVEYYFSDENILKDPFLLKHVRRNKEGYVSLKLISSFRKVRSLCRCWKAVALSLQKSQTLALNSDGTKIRRLAPLPDYDETLPNRMVIVYGFTDNQKLSVETVSEIFSKCGDIALVRVLRPGSSVPPELKRFLSKNSDSVQNKTCALVEFENHAGVKKALGNDSTKENCQPGLRVVPITMNKEIPKIITDADSSPKESPKKKKKTRRNNKNSRKSVGAEDEEDYRKRRSSSGSLGYSSSSSSGYLSSSPANDSRFPRRHSHQGVTVTSHYLDAPSSFASLNNRNFNGSRDRLNREGGKNSTPSEAPGSQSPWRRRREQFYLQSMSTSGDGSDTNSCLRLPLPVQALRQPRGPDGTKGFHVYRLSSSVEVSRGFHRPRLPSTVE